MKNLQTVRVVQSQIVHLVEERVLLHRNILEAAVHIAQQVVVGEALLGRVEVDLSILQYLR